MALTTRRSVRQGWLASPAQLQKHCFHRLGCQSPNRSQTRVLWLLGRGFDQCSEEAVLHKVSPGRGAWVRTDHPDACRSGPRAGEVEGSSGSSSVITVLALRMAFPARVLRGTAHSHQGELSGIFAISLTVPGSWLKCRTDETEGRQSEKGLKPLRREHLRRNQVPEPWVDRPCSFGASIRCADRNSHCAGANAKHSRQTFRNVRKHRFIERGIVMAARSHRPRQWRAPQDQLQHGQAVRIRFRVDDQVSQGRVSRIPCFVPGGLLPGEDTPRR